MFPKVIKILVCFFFIILFVSTNIVSAHEYPFAYYSGTFSYDATTNLLTFPSTNISMVQYKDGTLNFSDPVIGAYFQIGNLYNSDTNNLIFGPYPGGSTGPVSFAVKEGDVTYISGLLDEVIITTVGTSGAKLQFGKIYDVTIDNSSGSRYLDELGSKDLSLFISFTFTSGSNDFTEDASGNISGQLGVVPEPLSSILFLTGGAVLSLRRILKKVI